MITQFQRKYHSRTYRNSANGAIAFPDDLYSDVIAIKTQIINILKYNHEYLHKIKDINIIYLQSINCLGVLLYFHCNDSSIYNQDLFTIFNKHFNVIRFIDNQCNKYWECPYFKCSYQFNTTSIDINGKIYFCEKCQHDLTFQHNPNNNHFYHNLSMNHMHPEQINNFMPKERSCIKYKFLTSQQFNKLKNKQHQHQHHQTNNNQNSPQKQHQHQHQHHHHHHQKGHRHHSPKRKPSRSPHKHNKKTSQSTNNPDPAQQEELQKKNAITMSLFSEMS